MGACSGCYATTTCDVREKTEMESRSVEDNLDSQYFFLIPTAHLSSIIMSNLLTKNNYWKLLMVRTVISMSHFQTFQPLGSCGAYSTRRVDVLVLPICGHDSHERWLTGRSFNVWVQSKLAWQVISWGLCRWKMHLAPYHLTFHRRQKMSLSMGAKKIAWVRFLQ